jgi:hypothetical protein
LDFCELSSLSYRICGWSLGLVSKGIYTIIFWALFSNEEAYFKLEWIEALGSNRRISGRITFLFSSTSRDQKFPLKTKIKLSAGLDTTWRLWRRIWFQAVSLILEFSYFWLKNQRVLFSCC